jgi:splicing factor U2AF subunit
LKVRRPNDYRPELVNESTLGPIPVFDTASLGIISTNVSDGPNKIFIGGIPYQLGDSDIIDILSSFGKIRAFNLVRDPNSTTSKGYAFCEYVDPSVTSSVIEGLNGLPIMDKQLTVRVANPSGASKALAIVPGLATYTAPIVLPTSVIVLKNMVTRDEVNDDAEYNDILEDVTAECAQYGRVLRVLMPRSKQGYPLEVEGNVFVQYSSTRSLSGRKFEDRSVVVDYFDENKFSRGELV